MSGNEKNDFDSYRTAKREIDAETREWINVTSQRAYDYGVLAIKNVLFVSGGALLAIPAIAGLSNKLDPTMAAGAGLLFAVAVGLSVLSIYVIHINWMSHFHLSLWNRQKQTKQAWDAYLPEYGWAGECDAVLQRKEKFHTRLINVTFFMPHVLGLAAFVFFALGCLKLYQSVGH